MLTASEIHDAHSIVLSAMQPTPQYAWPLLERSSWTWLAAAGGIAFVAQLGLHLLLSRWRRDPQRFVRGILVGAVLRLLVVVTALVSVTVQGHPHPVALLLGLAGFLCGMLMVEASLDNSNWYWHLGAVGVSPPGGVAVPEGAVHR